MRRLSNTEFNFQSGARGRAEEVRADAEILFGKSQERYLFWLAVIRLIKKASHHYTTTGIGFCELRIYFFFIFLNESDEITVLAAFIKEKCIFIYEYIL